MENETVRDNEALTVVELYALLAQDESWGRGPEDREACVMMMQGYMEW